jgi:hypothetical protein
MNAQSSTTTGEEPRVGAGARNAPVGAIIICRGDVAQLGERRVRNAKVEGSIPFVSTNRHGGPGLRLALFICAAKAHLRAHAKTQPLAHHLADVFALQELAFEFLQLGAERIAGRDHAERFAVLDDRHVTESAFVHHQ